MPNHVYETPLEGEGAGGDEYRPAHDDEHGTDPGNYSRHYRLQDGVVHLASDVRIPTFEDLAEAEDSDVRKLSEDEVAEWEAAGRAIHSPSDLPGERGGSGGGDDGDDEDGDEEDGG